MDTLFGQLTSDLHALVKGQLRIQAQLIALTEIVQHRSVDIDCLKANAFEMHCFLKGIPFLTQLVRPRHVLSPTERDTLVG